jgi:hypothetical protein
MDRICRIFTEKNRDPCKLRRNLQPDKQIKQWPIIEFERWMVRNRAVALWDDRSPILAIRGGVKLPLTETKQTFFRDCPIFCVNKNGTVPFAADLSLERRFFQADSDVYPDVFIRIISLCRVKRAALMFRTLSVMTIAPLTWNVYLIMTSSQWVH